MKKTNCVDPHVGSRIRSQRLKLKWTLADLSEKLHMSPQQVQKYEAGKARVSANILYKLSCLMAVNYDYFFEGLQEKLPKIPDYDTTHIIPTRRLKPIDLLLIDHNPEDVLKTRKAIEKSGIDVNFHLLNSGEQALSFLKNPPKESLFVRPEIILLEINLPRLAGGFVLKELKRDRQLSDIPVLILANSINADDMNNAYRHNTAGFVRKSLNFQTYCQQIRFLLKYWSWVVTLPRMGQKAP